VTKIVAFNTIFLKDTDILVIFVNKKINHFIDEVDRSLPKS